jgi:hypothetical protein
LLSENASQDTLDTGRRGERKRKERIMKEREREGRKRMSRADREEDTYLDRQVMVIYRQIMVFE